MPRRRRADLHGLLAVDKPAGWTSHDVVGRVRRLTGVRRVGHAGTLDPFATGVLVVAVGKATRLLRFVQEGEKRYVAHVILGAETDSGDIDGTVVQTSNPQRWPSREALERVLAGFTGTITQVPPAHSAIRVDGKRLYEHARAGTQVDIPERTVTIHEITLERYDPPDLILEIACSTGTYIRSLARDIGRELQTCAYCHGLCRTRVGDFELPDAWDLDELGRLDIRGEWPAIAEHPDSAVQRFPAAIVDRQGAEAWYHGRSVRPIEIALSWDGPLRVYDVDGRFLGLGESVPDLGLKPAIVFAADEGSDSS